jgi:hypothetical protein
MGLFNKKMKNALAERGYKHCAGDDNLSLHGEYARHMQYAFSKEILIGQNKVVDIIFLGADMQAEKVVIGFVRENVSIEKGVIENGSMSIPLGKFSIEEFEKQLDRLIPKKVSLSQGSPGRDTF